MSSIKRKGFLGIASIAIALFAFFGVFMFSCETDNTLVNLALKKGGKVYLFSKLGSFLVENSLENNESPSVFPFIQVFDDDGLFVAPRHVEDISNLLGGNMKIYVYPEKSCDGYVTEGEEKFFDSSHRNISTENIGEQMREKSLEIINPANNDTLRIRWEKNPKTNEDRAIENCEVKSFWIETQFQPGETTTSADDFLMINLNTLVEFYNNGSSLELNKEEQILYIIQN